MLRQKIYYHGMPLPPVQSMFERQSVDVLVDVCDPESGECISQRVEKVIRTKELTDESQVRHDTAEMYSIENLLEAGVQPKFLNGAYLRAGIDSFNDAQAMSNYLESKLESAELDNKFESENQSSLNVE